MHIFAIVWHPNAKWDALSEIEKLEYLKTLDEYIRGGRVAGAIVLGWSEIDRTLPKAPKEGFIGVFGVDSAEQLHAFEGIVAESNWYEYFDSTNIGIHLQGATAAEPHKIYAQLLGVNTE
jgi:hypothetical protein